MLRRRQDHDLLAAITRDLLAVCARIDTLPLGPERYNAELERRDLVQQKYEALGFASPPF